MTKKGESIYELTDERLRQLFVEAMLGGLDATATAIARERTRRAVDREQVTQRLLASSY